MEDGRNSEIHDDTRRKGRGLGPEPQAEGSYVSWRLSMTSISVDLDDHLMG